MALVRACFLISDDYGGGIRTVTTGLVDEIHAVAPGDIDISLLALKSSCGWLNPTLYEYPITFLNSPAASHDIHLLLSWLRHNRPDVLVLNGCLTVDPYIPLLARFTRVVFVSHDYTHAALSPAVIHFSSLHAHVSVSAIVSSVIRHHLPLGLRSSQKLVVIPNGIKAALLPSLSLSQDTPIRIAYLGGDEQRKGFRAIARILEALVQFTPQPVHITFAGRYKTPIPDSPGRQITNVCRQDLSPTEVAQLLGESHVLLAPSYRESFGMVVLEAAAHGCVPITWRLPTGPCQLIGTIPYLRQHCLVEPFSYEKFAKAITAVYNQHGTYASALSSLCAEFSSRSSACHYVHLLSEVSKSPLLTQHPYQAADQTLPLPGDASAGSKAMTSASGLVVAARRLRMQLKRFLITLFHLILHRLEDASPLIYYRLHLLAYCSLLILPKDWRSTL